MTQIPNYVSFTSKPETFALITLDSLIHFPDSCKEFHIKCSCTGGLPQLLTFYLLLLKILWKQRLQWRKLGCDSREFSLPFKRPHWGLRDPGPQAPKMSYTSTLAKTSNFQHFPSYGTHKLMTKILWQHKKYRYILIPSHWMAVVVLAIVIF